MLCSLLSNHLCDSGRHVYLGSKVILHDMFSHIGLDLPESFPEVPGMGNQMKRTDTLNEFKLLFASCQKRRTDHCWQVVAI